MSLYAAHVAAFLLTGLLLLVVAAWVRRKGIGRTADAFLVLLAVNVVWTLFATTGLVAPGPELKRSLQLVANAVAVLSPFAWFVFTLHYTGRDHWLRRSTWAALAGLYVVLAGLLLTNPIHELLGVAEYASEPFPHLKATIGPIAPAYYLILYGLIVVGLVLLFQLFLTSRRASRGQAAAIILATLVSLGVNAVSAYELVPLPGFDYSALGAGLFAVIAGWGLFRHQLFSVAPLARTRLFDDLTDAVIVVDRDRRLVDFNRSADVALSGLEGRIGDPLEAVVPALVADPDAGGVEQFAEQWTRHTDAGPRSLAISTTPLGRGDRVQGYALVVRDVTDVESYARQLERQTEQLERVASTISHDLRNPLSIADGHVDLARDGHEAADLERAAAALDRIDRIFDDVLTLAREGRAVGDRTSVSLADTARRAWGTTPTETATLELAVDDDWLVYADENRLLTVFENLFRNAVEHAGANVSVRIGLVADGDGFSVEDDGPGIPEGDRERAFEYGHTTAETGTGIGLALVASVANAHDWEVAIETGRDGGTRFRFDGVGLRRRSDDRRDGPSPRTRDTADEVD